MQVASWGRGTLSSGVQGTPHGLIDPAKAERYHIAHLGHKGLDVASVKGVYSLRLSVVVKVDEEHVVSARPLQSPSRLPPR